MKNLFYLLFTVSLFIHQPVIQAQTLQSILPDSAYQGDGLSVTISGEGTHFSQATYTIVYLNQASSTIFPTQTIIQNNTRIDVEFEFTNNHKSGIYDLYLYNDVDESMDIPSAFELLKDTIPPEITAVEPDSAYLVDQLMVNISGSHTHFKQASNVIRLRQGTYTISPDYQYATNYDQIEAEYNFDAMDPTGFYDLEIENEADGVLTFENAIEHLSIERPMPVLKNISPDIGYIDSTLMTTITGENTRFNQGTNVTVILINENNKRIYASENVINDTKMQVYFNFRPYHDTGLYNVHVDDYYDDNLMIEDGFYLKPDQTPPLLHTINPNQAKQGETIELQISGKNTHFQQGTSSVVWLTKDEKSILPVSKDIINDTLIHATFDFNWTDSIGYYDVHQYNVEDREILCKNCFLLKENPNAPALAGLSPSEGNKGQQLTLTVTGSNTHFQQATSVSYYLSKSQTSIFPDNIHVINDSIAELDFSFTHQLTPQQYDLHASNPIDGGLKLTKAFTLNDYNVLPQITSLSTDTIFYNENNTIHLGFDHSHFIDASEHSLFLKRTNPFYEIQVNNITLHQNDSLTFTVKPENAVPGSYSIVAYNSLDGEITLHDTIKIQHRPEVPSIINLINDTLQLPGQYTVNVYCQNTHLGQGNDSVYLLKNGIEAIIEADSVIIYDEVHLKAFFTIHSNDIGTYDLYITNSADGTLTAPNALIYNVVTNIQKQDSKNTIKIYPNPTSGLIYIESRPNAINHLLLHSIQGTTLLNKPVTQDGIIQLDLQRFGRGTYILTIINENQKNLRKVIVK